MRSQDRLLNGYTIRLDGQTAAKLDRIARAVRLKRADLIRCALCAALPSWEKDGVRMPYEHQPDN